MPRPAPGDRVALQVLGSGRVEAVVTARDELDWHGLRGLAWKIRLMLPDGSPAEAMQIGDERLTFLDPRHRVASSAT